MAKNIATDLPYNSDAERAVLGAAMISSDLLYNVLSSLDCDDFFEGRHQTIYKTLCSLQEKHINIDVLTMTEELMNIKELDNIGGVDYLKQCVDSIASISSLDFYINIVRNQSVLRQMLICIRDIDNEYRTGEIEDIDSFIQRAEFRFNDATQKRRVSTFKNVKDVSTEVKMKMENQVVASEDNVTGLSTGFSTLNNYTNGFQKGELTILAARPSVGKTALALNFAYKAAKKSGVPVAIFSLEMASNLLVTRLVASESNVSLSKISTGKYSSWEKEKIDNAIREISNVPIYIDDTPGIKLMDIIAKSRQLQASCPNLGLILIDYLGLVQTTSSSRNPDSRQEEVRKISLALKALARDLKVPIVVLSQLSRDVEKRDNKRPMLSDLRDSGSIEQDADVVMLLYRKDYYKDQKEGHENGNKTYKNMSVSDKYEMIKERKEKQAGQLPGDVSYVEVNVAKNRNGQTGKVGLLFYKAYGRFEVPPKEWEEEMRNIDNELAD